MGGQRHALAALPLGKTHGTHCIGCWVGHRAGLDACNGIRSPDIPARSEPLYRLSCPGPMWDKMKMVKALKALKSKKMELKQASVLEVQRSILKGKVNNKETDVGKFIDTRVGRKQLLPYILEEELVNYCPMMSGKFFWANIKKYKIRNNQLDATGIDVYSH